MTNIFSLSMIMYLYGESDENAGDFMQVFQARLFEEKLYEEKHLYYFCST